MLCGKNGYLLVKQITFLLFCLITGNGFAQLITLPEAQKAAPPSRLISFANGFPEQAVTEIVQDSTGFTWIATIGSGLARYDGKNIKRFTHTDGDSSTIASNFIWKMHRDYFNRLWLVYASGAFDLFDPVTEKVRHLSAELNFRKKVSAVLTDAGNEILFECRSLFEDSKHRLWLLGYGFAARVDASVNGSILFYPKFTDVRDRPAAMNETPDGHLLIATNSYIKETDENWRLIRHTALPLQSIRSNLEHFFTYTTLRNDTLYMGMDKGVNVYNFRTGQVSFRGGIPSSVYKADHTGSPQNNRFLFYDTAAAHLYQYTAGEAGFTDLGKYVYPDNIDVATYGLVYFYDKWGGLWHANINLYYSSWHQKPFTIIHPITDVLQQITKYLYNIPEEIAARWISTDALYPWIRSPAGALYIIDSSRSLQLMAPAPYGADQYADGHKWTVLYKGINGLLLSDGAFDEANRLWIADIAQQELFTIDTLGQVRTCPQKFPVGFNIDDVTANRNGGCWVVQYNKGLQLYSTEKGLIKVIDGKTRAGKLPETSLLQMARDSIDKNILWITTQNSGIVRFNEQAETWTTYTTRDGWPSNSIYTPVVDHKGYLWYQTGKGVYRFDTQKKKHQFILAYLENQSADQINSAVLMAGSHQLWFAFRNTSVIINTDKIAQQGDVSIALTGLKVNNTPMADGDTSLVPLPVNILPVLHLAYDQNFVSFQFAALDYALPDQIRYRYQLKGIDKDWVENGTGNEAVYTSLPPGDYIFNVNATNGDGNWSSIVKSIPVIISPPWWRTWWMYGIYASVLVAASWFFIRTRLRRLQLKQQVVLKQKQAEQAQAMEETKSRFFTNITHELRTPLTLILSPVQRQLQEGAATYSPQLLKGVYHNSKLLLRLINQLLDMSKLEGGNMPVTLSRGKIILFVDGLLNPFRQQAAARNITFLFVPTAVVHVSTIQDAEEHQMQPTYQQPGALPAAPVRGDTNRDGEEVQPDDFPEEHLFDSDKLEKVLYNLLSNAFKFTPDGGEIQVVVSRQSTVGSKSTFCIQVSDSGIGIPPDSLPHIFDRFYQVNASTTRKYEGTGIGLSLVKELTELMGGEIKAESTLGTGSVFTIYLPLMIAGPHSSAPLTDYQATTPEQTLLVQDAAVEAAPVTDGKKPLVLVADDNEQLRHFIAESLAPHYQVITAVNGEAGFQTAITELPELIISDVMMPVMDGYEFCRRVKENPLTSHIGFVMLTAKTADESRMSGLRLGADHYLGKPFQVEELLLVTGNLLKRQQRLRDFYSKQLQPAEKLPPVAEVEDEFLRSVYTIIENNLDSDGLDVDFLASELAVSRRTLNRKLSAVANTSANEIIRSYRLKKAAGLLLKGQNVSEAAYTTGFSTPSWFSQCFKEMYGVTPVQYAETGGMSQN